MNQATFQQRMRDKLTAAFQPILLEIKDDSAKHKGHSGHDPRGETHFILRIVSEAFEGQSRVARHRGVYAVLTDEMAERVHALNIEALSPSEYNHK